MPLPPGPRSGVALTKPEVARCSVCQDAGYLRASVPIGHPSFGRLFACDCKKLELERRRSLELQELSNLDAFASSTFEDFDQSVPGSAQAFQAATAFASDPTGWLFLYGPCGIGKTHLAVAIAKRLVASGTTVYFAVVPDLLDHLRATFDPSSGVAYDHRFTAIRNAPLLVLDDLGTENTTPWAREKLFQIINHRYKEQLPTVLTSNQDHKRIEERILSRIMDQRLTTFVDIDAEDFRRPFGPRKLRTPKR
jgi:DNA replication protein DnaC